jgi:hypothetical protein
MDPRPHDGLKEDRGFTPFDCSVGSALSCGLEAPVALLNNVASPGVQVNQTGMLVTSIN